MNSFGYIIILISIIILYLLFYLFYHKKKLNLHYNFTDAYTSNSKTDIDNKKIFISFEDYKLDPNLIGSINFSSQFTQHSFDSDDNNHVVNSFKTSNIFKSTNYILGDKNILEVPKIVLYDSKIHVYNKTNLNLTKFTTKIIGTTKISDAKSSNSIFYPVWVKNKGILYYNKILQDYFKIDNYFIFLFANSNILWTYYLNSVGEVNFLLLKYNSLPFCFVSKIINFGKIYWKENNTNKFYITFGDDVYELGNYYYTLIEKKNDTYYYKIPDIKMELFNYNLIFFNNEIEGNFKYTFEFEYLAFALKQDPIIFLSKIINKSIDDATKIYNIYKAKLKSLFTPTFFNYKDYHLNVHGELFKSDIITPDKKYIIYNKDISAVFLFKYINSLYFYITSNFSKKMKYVLCKYENNYAYNNENELVIVPTNDVNILEEIEVFRIFINYYFGNDVLLNAINGVDSIVTYDALYKTVRYEKDAFLKDNATEVDSKIIDVFKINEEKIFDIINEYYL